MTEPVFVIGPQARADLDEHVLWLRNEAGPEVAARFSRSADRTLLRLAATPGIGSPVESHRPDLRGLRKSRVAGFRNMLIFYMSRDDGIFILRVMHAAQDWLPSSI